MGMCSSVAGYMYRYRCISMCAHVRRILCACQCVSSGAGAGVCPGFTAPSPPLPRVFGLVVDAEVLAEHRDDRRNLAKYGVQTAAAYSNLRHVVDELEAVEVRGPCGGGAAVGHRRVGWGVSGIGFAPGKPLGGACGHPSGPGTITRESSECDREREGLRRCPIGVCEWGGGGSRWEAPYPPPHCPLPSPPARQVMLKKKRICKINVTNMPMESVADKIIKMLGERFGDIFDDPHTPCSSGSPRGNGLVSLWYRRRCGFVSLWLCGCCVMAPREEGGGGARAPAGPGTGACVRPRGAHQAVPAPLTLPRPLPSLPFHTQPSASIPRPPRGHP